MTIDEQIEYLEGRVLEDLERLGPKERLTYYQGLKEFQRPKLQRSTVFKSDEIPDTIKLILVDGN